MPVVDDLIEAVGEIADAMVYDLIRYICEALWFLIKAGLILSYQIVSVDRWLSQNAFPPLIQGTNSGMRVAASMTFVLALFILGLTYLMAVWIRLDVVRPQRAFLWFLAGTLFFQVGPALYGSFHEMRTRLSSAFYAAGLAGISGSDSPFSAYTAIQMDNNDPLPMNDLCDNLGPYIEPNPPGGFHETVRGSDVALVFLRATGYDLMGFPPPYAGGYCGPTNYTIDSLPHWWVDNPQLLGGYFYEEVDSSHFDDMSPEARRDSIRYAVLGWRRLGGAMPLVMLAIAESLIGLLLTIAEGLTFLSFGLAIVFSYFNRTEGIALSIIDLMIELIIQTVVIALIQSIIVGCTFAAAATGNPFLLLGMGILSAILMLILLWSGFKAVFNSFNRLFQAIGRTTGGAFLSPSRAAAVGTGLVTGAGLAATGIGMAGVGLTSSLLNSNDEPDSLRARAMRGSGDMLKAASYTVAAATHNPAISLVAHTAGMVGGVMGDMLPPPQRRRMVDDSEQVSPTITPLKPVTSTTTPLQNGILMAAIPIEGQASLFPNRQGEFYPDRKTSVLENVGEEIEDAITQQSPIKSIPPFINEEQSADEKGRLSKSNSASDQTATVGRLRIEGVDQVGSVIGDAINGLYSQRTLNGQPAVGPVSYAEANHSLAHAMGVNPVPGHSAIMGDASGMALFMNRAMSLGMGGEQAASLLNLVKRSEGQVAPDLSKALSQYLTLQTGLAPQEAKQQADGLLHTARIVPNALVAYGEVPMPPPPVVVKPATYPSAPNQKE